MALTLYTEILQQFKSRFKKHMGISTILDTNEPPECRDERFGDWNIEPVLKNPVPQVAVTDLRTTPTHQGCLTSFSRFAKIHASLRE